MARRYYGGLSGVGGIADGFGQGFGAAQGMIEAKQDQEYRQEKLRADAESNRLQQKFRTQQLENEAERIRLIEQGNQDEADRDATAAGLTADYRAKVLQFEGEKSERTDTLAQTKAEVELERQKTLGIDAQRQLDDQTKRIRDEEALESIAQLDLLIKRARQIGTAPDLETVNTLIEKTSGTKFDLTTILGADYQNDIANLSSTIREQLSTGQMLDTSDPRILAGADALVNANAGAMIGRTVDGTFVNAPEAYKDGNYRVVSREATGIDISESPDGLMFSSDVLVTLERKDTPGQFYHYIAPMTDGRQAGSTQPAQVPINQIIDGMGGTAILIDTLNRDMAPVIRQARIDQRGDESAFREAVDREIASMVAVMERSPSARTYMGSKTNQELSQSPNDIDRIAEDRALGLGRKTERFGDQAKQGLLEAQLIIDKPLQAFKVEGPDGRPTKTMELSDKEIFELASTLGDGGVTDKTKEMLREIAKKKGAVDTNRRLFRGTGFGNVR